MDSVTAMWDYADDERTFGAKQVALAHERGCVHLRSAYYPHATEDDRSDLLDKVPTGYSLVASSFTRDGDSGTVVIDHADTGSVVSISLNNNMLNILVMSRTPGDASQVADELYVALPEEKLPPNSDKVLVNFWMMTAQGPRNMPRKIVVPSWDEVRENYPGGPRLGMEELMVRRSWSQELGQLLLWTGTPGTGKTYALRALAREWSGWCDLHYITDPEQFFGRHADYMMQVMFSSSNDEIDFELGNTLGLDEEDSNARSRWKILVLEDSGEMLASDAKAQVGQALSRLLNVVDGLIGQGMQVIVLVTTNEEIKNLHEAVARPGRCAQRLTFDKFHTDEARTWLEDRGQDATRVGGASYTLAELYAHLSESMSSHHGNGRVGFSSS